ncbi:PadR family transcriptional regulator [Paenibacillus radicis (ex Gao et al. 2016)]|uniref:PadR family transcriptional regulator n=1 Tax=Paenibacillus radicis (ex Gao et al. 2016) TaxID=1737354 RepID=A0A917M3R1_9BACL|nr:PadR family transcriptional regulator [Paenibacillus radicis (ex Gao et al. 2016)]GGG75587.1 PadR family transcriptional regulator [Paenibacillus radicis (ex Gao et al. 2016)]
MPRNDTLEMGELTDTAFYILLSVVEPKHGYLIMQWIETTTAHRLTIGPASLYTTIKKLLAAGFIELVADGDEKRKTYGTTAAGIELLRQDTERRRAMVRHADQILGVKGEV